MMLKRALACLLVVMMAIILNRDSPPGETFFCAAIGLAGAIGFFVIRPSVTIVDRIRLVSFAEMMPPLVVTGYLFYLDPASVERHTKLLVFMFIFFCGVGVGAKLLLSRRRK